MNKYLRQMLRLALAGAVVLAGSDASAQISRLGSTFPTIASPIRGSAVAYDPVNRVYLTVASNGTVFGRFVSEDGAVVGSTHFTIQASGIFAHFPGVAYSPDADGGAGAFLVVWHESDLVNWRTSIHARLVSLGRGGAFGADVQVAAAASFPEASVKVDYSKPSKKFLVVWGTDAGTTNVDGVVVSNTVTASAILPIGASADGEAKPGVACHPTAAECMVSYSGWGAIGAFAKSVVFDMTSETANEATRATLQVTAGTYQTDVVHNASSGEYLVLWYEDPTGAIYGRRVAAGSGSPASSVLPLSTYFAAKDSVDAAYNPSSRTSFLIAMGKGTYENGGVEIDAAGNPGLAVEITATGNKSPGNFYPSIGSHGSRPEWLMGTAAGLAAMYAQRLGSDSTGNPPPPPPPPTCSYSLSPTGISISAIAADGNISVSTGSGCEWSATSNSGFLSFQNASGRSGSGSLPFSVAANDTGAPRTGTATIAGLTFTVSQAAPCSYAINPVSVSLSSNSDSGTIFVTTQDGCPWSAVSQAEFIGISNGSGRVGSGTVPFTVTANTTGAPRGGTATIAGITFSVTQAAPCTYSITPPSVSLGNVGDSGTVFVTTQSGCPWSASSQAGFISFDNAVNRWGTGSLSFSVATNKAASARTGYGVIAGQSFSVTQSASAIEPGIRQRENSRADFDGDGKNDLLWQNTNNGSLAAWKLDGANVMGSLPLSHGVVDNNWHIVGSGDFNSDGHPDIVWQHQTEGWVYLWYMDGVTRIGYTSFSLPRAASAGWKVVGVGDMNVDGRPDLVWQHPTERWLAVWLINGITVTEVALSPSRVLDADWTIVGVGDFNADGYSDILWRHNVTGEMGMWIMNGLTRATFLPLNPGVVIDKQWQIVGVVDVNGDNIPDLIWQHASAGWVATWYMNVEMRIDFQSFTATQSMDWKVAGPK